MFVCTYACAVLVCAIYVVNNASLCGRGVGSVFCIHNVYLSELGAIIVFNVYLI